MYNDAIRFALQACLFVLIAIALVLAPSPCDAQNPAAAQTDDAHWDFKLQVRGPEGQPAPNVNVSTRNTKQLGKEQVLEGEFIKSYGYGARLITDDQGVLRLRFAEHPGSLTLVIEHAGYAPYWAAWRSSGQPVEIPTEFTAVLQKAWSVGGVVVDESGKPLEGATVHPRVDFKKRAGDTQQLGVGTQIKTDKQGAWRYDCVPDDMKSVHVTIDFPNFQPARQDLARVSYALEPDEKPHAQIVISPGLMVHGRVTDTDGEPIAGALVKTKLLNELRKATTDESGYYILQGCEPHLTRIVVSATGKATDMKEVRVKADMQPVDFEMQPGGKVRIRVVDEQGNGIPKARIFFQRWRGRFEYFEFDHVSQYADDNGVWEWNEALDSFSADICRPGGMQLSEQPIIAREEEYVFNPPPALVVSGKVTNAKTGEPVEAFHVIPGLRSGGRTNWIERDSFDAKGGKYRVRMTHGYPAHLVKIEAEGYRVAISRDIKTDEGEVNFDFELQPAESIAVSLETPDGKPAAGAKIALGVADSQISVKNGAIDDGSTYATRINADSNGHFSIPPREGDFQLVITHSEGFAYLRTIDGPIPNAVRLQRWARAEGTFRVGDKPAEGVTLEQNGAGIHSYGDSVPNIFTSERTTTGEGGHYVFERLFPGEGRIGRRIILLVDDGATEVTSSARVAATFKSGETTHLDLGGVGRAVIGQLVPPDNAGNDIHWPLAILYVSTGIVPPPRPTPPADVRNNAAKNDAWWAEWRQSPEGIAWQAARQSYEQARKSTPSFTVTVGDEGRFRIDDVPAGVYKLSARFRERGPGGIRDYRFEVPKTEGGNEPFDLGELQLE
ncbi:carboxypeptidase-like regulatory domain-containing protein [Aeoliella sp.]|uniref:carboxypeptidase-like regulatory domain-containing protein n=1 Tax=Aeoliella sp. TaxID=2795800 RepID=UPI003CCC21D6